jgi:hypothetical protein
MILDVEFQASNGFKSQVGVYAKSSFPTEFPNSYRLQAHDNRTVHQSPEEIISWPYSKCGTGYIYFGSAMLFLRTVQR